MRAHRRGDRFLERPLVAGDQRRDHLGVRGGVERDAAVDELAPQLGRVREVAVVGERDRPRAAVLDDRLRVRPRASSRSSSSGSAPIADLAAGARGASPR